MASAGGVPVWAQQGEDVPQESSSDSDGPEEAGPEDDSRDVAVLADRFAGLAAPGPPAPAAPPAAPAVEEVVAVVPPRGVGVLPPDVAAALPPDFGDPPFGPGEYGNPLAGWELGLPEALATLPEVLSVLTLACPPEDKVAAVATIRKALSVERNPPIEPVIASGAVPLLVRCLHEPHDKLQFEAAWALTNVASGTSAHTTVVVACGAIPRFMELLANSDNADVQEQCVWALGNVAGDSPKFRDYVLAQNAIDVTVSRFAGANKLSFLRNATWSLSNFCRGKPRPPFALTARALPTLSALLFYADEEVLTDACWALSYLSDGPNDQIQMVLEMGVISRIVELLTSTSAQVRTPALRTIGNIVTGSDLQTQVVLNAGALASLPVLLQSDKRSLRKESLWTVSNITAGSSDQIQEVMDAGILPLVCRALAGDELDVRKEAAWAISNALSGGTDLQVSQVLQMDVIPPLVELMASSEPKIALVGLKGIENVLKTKPLVGETAYIDLVAAAGGTRAMSLLIHHEDDEIRTLASELFPYLARAGGVSEGGVAPLPQKQESDGPEEDVSDDDSAGDGGDFSFGQLNANPFS